MGDKPTVDVKGVEILIRGEYKGIPFTDEHINALVERYDTSFHEGQINLGHPWDDTAAEYGAIERVYYEAPVMKADLCRVPEELANEMLHGGKYPYRSIEFTIKWIKDEDSEEGWYKPVPDYLTGLALLGVHPPAVKGMAKITPEQIHQPQYQHMQVVGFADTENWIRLTQEPGASALHKVIPTKEGSAMPNTGKQEETVSLSDFNAAKAQIEDLLKRDKEREAELAEAKAEKAKLSEEKAEVEQDKVELSGKVDSLTETTNKLLTKAALAEKNARLSDAKGFMEKLRAEKGGTVAALSNTNIVALMAELDGMDTELKLADDKTVRLGDELRAVLSALPKFDGHIELAPAGDEGKDKYCGLSQEQRKMADDAGVTYEALAETIAEMKGGA